MRGEPQPRAWAREGLRRKDTTPLTKRRAPTSGSVAEAAAGTINDKWLGARALMNNHVNAITSNDCG